MLKRLIPILGASIVLLGVGSMLVGLATAHSNPVGSAASVGLVVAILMIVGATWLWSGNRCVRDQHLSFWSVLKEAKPPRSDDRWLPWTLARVIFVSWVIGTACIAAFAAAIG